MRPRVDDDGEITAINVAPLVDVVLVLLVILMVSGVALSRVIPLEETGGGAETELVTLWVRVDARGVLTVDGVAVPWESLESRARAAREAHPNMRAGLAVDPGAPHETFIRLLDTLRRARIHARHDGHGAQSWPDR